MQFDYSPGATPLDPDEAAGLIPRHITTQGELNEWEQTNILHAMPWVLRQRNKDLLDTAFLREAHRRLFDQTWKWAGELRRSDKNIGGDWRHIPVDLRNLLDDVKAQIEFNAYPPDDLVLRFHHRLVWIHPFANGNGRHARLMADLLIQQLGRPAFSWGGQSLIAMSDTRQAYLSALRSADAHDYSQLLQFARNYSTLGIVGLPEDFLKDRVDEPPQERDWS